MSFAGPGGLSWKGPAGAGPVVTGPCGRRPGGSSDEWSTSTGRYAQGRVRPEVERPARAVGRVWPALPWLGDLPPQGVTCRPGPAVCVAVHRLVRAVDPALRRRRRDVGAGRQRVP